LLVLFVGSFMIVTFAETRLAAMTTIIKFLPHTVSRRRDIEESRGSDLNSEPLCEQALEVVNGLSWL
jgi:hypothetical protein